MKSAGQGGQPQDDGRKTSLTIQPLQRKNSSGIAGAEILRRMPEMVPGEATPAVAGEVPGLWSLWEVAPQGGGPRRDFFARFQDDGGDRSPFTRARRACGRVPGGA